MHSADIPSGMQLIEFGGQGPWECKNNRCAGRYHMTLPDLRKHIDLSHLSRVLLPCPIRGENEQLTANHCSETRISQQGALRALGDQELGCVHIYRQPTMMCCRRMAAYTQVPFYHSGAHARLHVETSRRFPCTQCPCMSCCAHQCSQLGEGRRQ